MKMSTLPRLGVALAVTAALLAAPESRSSNVTNDDSSLPDSLRPGYVQPIVGSRNDRAYTHGKLGLIRTTYGRASLYAAWRVVHLPVGALANENHRRLGDYVHGQFPPTTRDGDEIAAWLKARAVLVPQAPAAGPDYFRHGKMKLEGVGEINTITGQCGPDAYAFATRTLNELSTDNTLKDADRRLWIADQDAVFAQCTWAPETGSPPPLPAPPTARAPEKLKALNAYQHAAALFYRDDFTAARAEFDAIAAQPKHPMHAWAALGALRCVLRDAVRDKDWSAAVDDAWTKRGLRGAAFTEAMREPAMRRRARVDAAQKEINNRAMAARDDATLAPVQAAMYYTLRRAQVQFVPFGPLLHAMTVMDKPDYNPYTMSAIDLFGELYLMAAPERPQGDLAAKLRQHEWFDFIVAVQGCADYPKAPEATVCDAEHGHALERWQATRDNAWLLAALMTARQPGAADLPAADAARAVAADRPEWPSLQFYAARVLRTQGRTEDARVAIKAVLDANGVDKYERPGIEAEFR